MFTHLYKCLVLTFITFMIKMKNIKVQGIYHASLRHVNSTTMQNGIYASGHK